MKLLKCKVEKNEYTDAITEAFDFSFDNEITTEIHELPELPDDYSIGVIVGPSGSGKSTILKEFSKEDDPHWLSDKAIATHFPSPEQAIDKLTAVGLNTIPSWAKPYGLLSTGERFRADLARQLKSEAAIDEFTSVVDRNVAKAMCVSVRKYVDKKNLKRIIFATCHYDILDWLEPDWVFDTLNGEFYNGRYLHRRPEVKIDIREGSWKHWEIFKKFHYLDHSLNKAARCYLAFWNDNLVGFCAVLAMPNGYIKNAFRGHRTVIFPDYQGLGLGTRLSDSIGQMYIDNGKRYYSRTAHPRMGIYREKSTLWKGTSKNRRLRTDVNHKNVYKGHYADNKRICWSHEYIGKDDGSN